MKYLWISVAFLAMLSCAARREKTDIGTAVTHKDSSKTLITPAKKPCVDSSKINPKAICTRIYLPVCGCDSITYGNACEAEAAGLTWWRPGECGR